MKDFQSMIQEIALFQPYDEHERRDQQAMLAFLSRNPDALERSNLVAHMTSSGVVVNKEMNRVIFAFHNLYQSWSWVGGHNDGDANCLRVAMKETMEETGVTKLKPYSNDIFMLDVVYVKNHWKKGVLVPDHLHLNVTYLLIADEDQPLIVKPDENQDVRWFSFEEALAHVSEDRMIPIYQKAIAKIRHLQDNQAK